MPNQRSGGLSPTRRRYRSPPTRRVRDTAPDPRPPSPDPDESTGLPGIRSWRTVYVVVFGIFLLWVGLLTWLTEAYG